MESNCASQNQTWNLIEEKIKMGIYWFRGLALAVLFVLAGLFSPPAFSSLGIPLLKVLDLLIACAFIVYYVAVLSVQPNI